MREDTAVTFTTRAVHEIPDNMSYHLLTWQSSRPL